jgi:hypothetical protein
VLSQCSSLADVLCGSRDAPRAVIATELVCLARKLHCGTFPFQFKLNTRAYHLNASPFSSLALAMHQLGVTASCTHSALSAGLPAPLARHRDIIHVLAETARHVLHGPLYFCAASVPALFDVRTWYSVDQPHLTRLRKPLPRVLAGVGHVFPHRNLRLLHEALPLRLPPEIVDAPPVACPTDTQRLMLGVTILTYTIDDDDQALAWAWSAYSRVSDPATAIPRPALVPPLHRVLPGIVQSRTVAAFLGLCTFTTCMSKGLSDFLRVVLVTRHCGAAHMATDVTLKALSSWQLMRSPGYPLLVTLWNSSFSKARIIVLSPGTSSPCINPRITSTHVRNCHTIIHTIPGIRRAHVSGC